jgi:hypothetical protein
MKKVTTLTTVAVLVLACSALAGGPHCGKVAKTAEAKRAHCSKTECPQTAKVLASLPKMTYRAGDLETCCFKTAAEKAGGADKVHYVVDGKAYECKKLASAELASLLEKHFDEMLTVQYSVGGEYVGCPMAAQHMADEQKAEVRYRLAGVDFDSKEQAERAAKAAQDAVARLAGEKQGCSKTCDKGQTVAGKATKGCCAKGQMVAGDATKGCCAKGKMVAEEATKGCCAKGQMVAGEANKGCCAKGKMIAGDAKTGCSKTCPKGQTVAAGATVCCAKSGQPCQAADGEDRLARVEEMIRVAVEAATGTRAS